MSDTKASDFASKTAAQTASGDLFPFIDISETGNAKNSRITRDQLKTAMQTGLPLVVTGTGTVVGYEDNGSAESAPGPLDIEVTDIPQDGNYIELILNSASYTLWCSYSDPGGVLWVDLAGLITPEDAAAVIASTVSSASIPDIEATSSGATVNIFNSMAGMSANSSADAVIGNFPGIVNGGGSGADGVAPMGGSTFATVITQDGTKKLRPRKIGYFTDEPLDAPVRVALRVGGSDYFVCDDIPANAAAGEVTVGSFYNEWLTGKASASLRISFHEGTPVGGWLSVWAVCERFE